MNCARELEIAKALAAEAGAKLLQFGPELTGEAGRQRNSGECLTVAGLVADDLICSGLADAFPDDSMCSRHSGRQAGWTGRVWLVDAVEGEENYLLDGDEFGVSIGLAVHGRPVLGVVFNPARREMFAGRIEMGASLNGDPLRLQASSLELQPTVVVPQAEWQEISTLCRDHIRVVPGASIAYAMARVAAGVEAGLFSRLADRGCKTCAGAALVESAGGRATLLSGGDIYYRSDEMVQPTGIVVAPPAVHERLLASLRELNAAEPESGTGMLGNAA